MIASYTDSSGPGPYRVWIWNATSTMYFAISFSVMGGAVSREGAMAQRIRKGKLKAKWLQRPRLGAFEEPAGADAQAVMPRRQSRGVHRESRLPRQWSSHNLAGRQNCGVF